MVIIACTVDPDRVNKDSEAGTEMEGRWRVVMKASDHLSSGDRESHSNVERSDGARQSLMITHSS